MNDRCSICGETFGFRNGSTVLLNDYPAVTVCKNCRNLARILADPKSTERSRIAIKEKFEASCHRPEATDEERECISKYIEMALKEAPLGEEALMDEDERKAKAAALQLYLDNGYLNLTEEPVFRIHGARGRQVAAFHDFLLLTVDVTVGSVLTGNATDGIKIIFYKDIIGIQYKEPGVIIGYLQFETASDTQNNGKDNFFNENTFTFEKNSEEVLKLRQYVFERVLSFKRN